MTDTKKLRVEADECELAMLRDQQATLAQLLREETEAAERNREAYARKAAEVDQLRAMLAWADDRLDVSEGRRGVEFTLRWEAYCDPEAEYTAALALEKGMQSEADFRAEDDGREDQA